jgi:signal transduction histidine kinase
LRTVEPIAKQRQINLELRQHLYGRMELLADPSLLQRLLENLLLNALHSCLRGQSVRLRLSRRETAWLIEVQDGGCGFAAEDLPRLFQRFAHSGSGSAGVGLGLYLCRLICEAHGGTITASNDPNGGARVVVCYHNLCISDAFAADRG